MVCKGSKARLKPSSVFWYLGHGGRSSLCCPLEMQAVTSLLTWLFCYSPGGAKKKRGWHMYTEAASTSQNSPTKSVLGALSENEY